MAQQEGGIFNELFRPRGALKCEIGLASLISDHMPRQAAIVASPLASDVGGGFGSPVAHQQLGRGLLVDVAQHAHVYAIANQFSKTGGKGSDDFPRHAQLLVLFLGGGNRRRRSWRFRHACGSYDFHRLRARGFRAI